MKIRNNILCCIILSFLVAGLLQAQGAVRIFGVGGYGIGISSDYLESSNTYDMNDELDEQTDHYINGGKGMKYGGGIELPVKPNVALRVEYLMSSMPAITAVTEYESMDEKYETQYTAKGWNINAVVLIQVPMDNKTLYGGLGGGYFNASATIERTFPAVIIGPGYTIDIVEGLEEDKAEFSSAIGLVGVLGVEMALNDKASFFVEANLQAVNYEMKKLTVEKYEIDGEDYLDELDDDEKEVEFKKDDVDHPAPIMISGSNAAIRGGIKFSIN